MKIGTYAVERDYSHYVAYASKTIFAIVGTATRGPVGVATVCTSAQDLVNKFGPLKTNCMALYAGQYFLSQASKLYFVRSASDSVEKASVSVAGVNNIDGIVEDAVVFEFLEAGTFFNNYSLVISDSSVEDKYNILVKNGSGVTIESINDVELEDLTDTYTTNYIKVKSVNATAISLTAGTYVSADGNDGIDNILDADYITAASTLSADSIDMNLCAIPGVSSPAVISYMLNLVETRGDTLYLVDPPQGLTRDGVIQWHNGGGLYEHTAFNSSYGALYYDWVNIYDSVNKVQVQVPPSVVASASIAYSDRTFDVWYAPAGLQRGLIRGALNTATSLNKVDVDLLYGGDNNINAIYEDPQVGLVLWGQKTLYRVDSALNRINVRRLLNYLKRVITISTNYLTFEPNDRITWNSFESLVQPTLDSIQNRRGIYSYQIIKGESIVSEDDIDNYRMPCMIMIRPTKAAEEIPIHFVISSTGADFNEVLEANGIVNE